MNHEEYIEKIKSDTKKYINKYQLVSYMNNTKWNEFVNAMINEMPFEPPYIYKLLSEDDLNNIYFSSLENECDSPDSYDMESFNFYVFSEIEWVKVKPRYYEKSGGILAYKKILHDAETEFVEIMKKYNIPYEKTRNCIYTIYGYKRTGS